MSNRYSRTGNAYGYDRKTRMPVAKATGDPRDPRPVKKQEPPPTQEEIDETVDDLKKIAEELDE